MINITETEKKELREFIKNTVIEVLAELQSSTEVSPDNLSIDEFLKKIGVPLHFTGFSYISTALELWMQKNSYITNFSILYKKIASIYEKDSIKCIERGIQTAKESAFKNSAVLQNWFKKVPTTKDFIFTLLYHYKNHLYWY